MDSLCTPSPMPIADEPLFDSAHQALMFAYTFAANQHAVAAAVERQISDLGAQRYERLRHVSRGLHGLDGAGQAGMIKRQVESLPSHAQRRVIEARFAILDRPMQVTAMRELTLIVMKRLHVERSEVELVASLVQRWFGARCTLIQLQEQSGLSARTITTRWSAVHRRLGIIDTLAMNTIYKRLQDAGVLND